MKKVIFGQDDRVGEFVSKILKRKWTPGEATTIGLESNGELVAGVLYMDYNGANVCMHIGTAGENWLTREYLWYCFDYPFEQLGCKRVTAITASSNTRALEFEDHLGFIEETRLKDAHPDGDLVILKMRKEDCRFLKGFDHGQAERAAAA